MKRGVWRISLILRSEENERKWGPPENDNFWWILLDQVFHHCCKIANRSVARLGQQIEEIFKN